MAGAKVKDLAFADGPECPATKPFAILPALLENDGIGFGDVERPAIHLGLGEREVFWYAFGNGVVRKEGLYFAGLAVGLVVGKAAVGAGNAHEGGAVLLLFVGCRGGQLSVGGGRLSLEFADPFDLCLGALGGGEFGQRILLGALVHGEDKRHGPVGRMQDDEVKFAGFYAVD